MSGRVRFSLVRSGGVTMAASEYTTRRLGILYDDEWVGAVSAEWLQPEFWRLRGAIQAELGGRGTARVVDTPAGAAVLRRYHRGGLVARLVQDRYLFTGFERSRAWREWRVLHALHERGLPVPRPLMASCERRGPAYRAGLLTCLIPGAQPLSEVAETLSETDWQRLAWTLDAFFAYGVEHVDLNAGNVLCDALGRWYLVDFDRARLHPGRIRPARMLARLDRSLTGFGITGAGARLAAVLQSENDSSR